MRTYTVHWCKMDNNRFCWSWYHASCTIGILTWIVIRDMCWTFGCYFGFCGAEAVSSSWWLSAGSPEGRWVPKCNKRLVNEFQKASSRWKDHPNNLCSAYPWIMVSAINLIPLIIIINPMRPALVVPKLVKIVPNLSQVDSAILSITSSLNKFDNDIPWLIVGCRVISLA